MVFRKDGFISAGIRSRRSSSSSGGGSGGGIFRAVLLSKRNFSFFRTYVQQTDEVVIYAAVYTGRSILYRRR